MNKRNMIVEAALASGCTQANVKKCFDAVLESMKRALQKGEQVHINGLGSFSVIERKGYMGIAPRTKEVVYYPPGKFVRFKGSAALIKCPEKDLLQDVDKTL